MTVIIFDGPEAAGKTTLIRECQRLADVRETKCRQWRGRVSGLYDYVSPLHEDLQSNALVLWDRSWASEFVYDRLLARGLYPNEWYARENLEDPARKEGSLFVMVIVPPVVAKARRAERLKNGPSDDLVVDPQEEIAAFLEYGIRHNWQAVSGVSPTDRTAVNILEKAKVEVKRGN